ncbi:flagellar operon protein (TIGR03826 family) [Ruminiclostridium sufflavum DSM 19573]|uniref:Flagellar operon protein (TIGR03826 family) n=1 Tax=Ruminiclostridium sufflavum DSM 19573 TaxID=1121337 RepID=A0A318XPM2_9FIRM|nr:MerR family transcriptional regulator [Ruminiclostridium sufflavum]PYG89108.1 flagellar operon protein (TIGR03826 family) [Ruminiclostridium sufflavum DSM 19573]
MPDIRNCRRCGRMYNYLGGPPICPDCKKADEEVFKRVKDYLYDNPGATLSQVSMECDVSVEKIKLFLKEGRLEITDGANIILECERCGKAIKTGRFCDSCQHEVTNDIAGVAPRPPERPKEALTEAKRKEQGLRYLNKNH